MDRSASAESQSPTLPETALFGGFQQSRKFNMEPEMQHLQAPRENLDTWDRVTKLFLYSCIAITVLLALMALTLT